MKEPEEVMYIVVDGRKMELFNSRTGNRYFGLRNRDNAVALRDALTRAISMMDPTTNKISVFMTVE